MTGTARLPDDRERWVALREAYRHAELTLEQLWTRFFALGGDADLFELEAHLEGVLTMPDPQPDVLAVALNERLDELVRQRRVPMRHVLRGGRPDRGALRAIVELLEASHRAPPERLAALTDAAGAGLGVSIVVHLVDHEQRRLVALPSGDGPLREPLRIDGTLAGRAYQNLQILPSESGEPRLWVPLEDGRDRLGVLEVVIPSAADLYDTTLRDQCRWLALLVGHLVSSIGVYGDALERPRRSRRPTPSAELIWQQLPPLTAGTDDFMLAGSLEPAYAMGGDVFDYALSESTVSLAVLDAMGHGMQAALMAVAALAAYRSARRDGRGLHDQARAMDEMVATAFPGSSFVTGFLAELDLPSGRLRYVAAGHPEPLLLRHRRVVKRLSGGRRLPFGLGDGRLLVAEEALQPGDWLAVYTDGITEARDPDGRWFGEERLAELLSRAMAAQQPPPETVRRLTRDVLAHQQGLLQDDATVLLASWTASPRPGGSDPPATEE
jgi:hypothetical protein